MEVKVPEESHSFICKNGRVVDFSEVSKRTVFVQCWDMNWIERYFFNRLSPRLKVGFYIWTKNIMTSSNMAQPHKPGCLPDEPKDFQFKVNGEDCSVCGIRAFDHYHPDKTKAKEFTMTEYEGSDHQGRDSEPERDSQRPRRDIR